MEVAIGSNGSTPFQREVREWQRIDPNTGALLSGRLEADRWINGPLNTYGKVVDSQNVSQPNGMQHSHRKQLEVLQAHTSSGSMQVIRAQTVQTTSSRWSSSDNNKQQYPAIKNGINGSNFDNCLRQKTTNHLINDCDNNYSNNQQKNNHLASLSSITNAHTDHHYNNHHQINHIANTNNITNNTQSHRMASTPSLKLSNLMKSSNNSCNGVINGGSSTSDGRISPHNFNNNSMLLVQRHQSNNQYRNSNQNNDVKNGTATTTTTTSSLATKSQQNKQHQKQLNHQPTTENSCVGGGVVGVFDYDAKEQHQNRKIIENVCKEERETDFDLQRGRSVSTDDLATNWDENNHDVNDESLEWRRVSKIRRSFQFPKSTSSPPKSNLIRPIDLPPNCVSVSKIRQDLENGRRLNTAMRNNNVDLAALDTILNGNSDTELSPKSAKKAAFLTAESLKEIRGKLKKLSDESLYKDDFITNGIKNDTNNMQLHQTKNIEDDNNLNNSQQLLQDFQFHPKSNQSIIFQHTTNSLENRTKFRDTSSAEWHLRRKSYGFEKMSPPDNKSMMYRQETSTDSGIGRSSELENCSQTAGGTVITFGDNSPLSKNSTTIVLNSLRSDSASTKSPLVRRRTREISTDLDTTEIKRHSIAVDETKYVRDNLRKVFDTKTSIHLNGFYPRENLVNDEIGRQQQRKRVEFCKTEVHFAAESGRVNIVETDGKPPPTNNFRRRRRSSGNTYLDAISSGLQITHFGDEKKIGSIFLDQELEVTDELKNNNVTVSVPVTNLIAKHENNFVSMKSMMDELDQDEISLRGILKNKPIKPKPYHLGENIDNSESLWGVKLKPVKPVDDNELLTTAKNEKLLELHNDDHNEDKLMKNLQSVIDRVKFVEERKDGTSYSTKINLSLSDAPFTWNSDSKPLKSSTANSIDMVDFPSNHIPSHHIFKNEPKPQQTLKSTSLIMRQILQSKSNQIDNTNVLSTIDLNLSKNTSRAQVVTTNATKLISNMAAITKSSSANSIFLEKDHIYRPKYSSSLDGDVILNEQTLFNDNKSSSQSSMKSSSSFIYDGQQHQQNRIMSVLQEEPYQKEELNKPIAAPRIKVIGSSSAINHQISQLRRMYERETVNISDGFESDESKQADEEVKRFLEGKTDSRSTDHENVSKTTGTSDSWSRIKAKKIFKKSQIDVKDVPQSNIMSIKLRSPQSTLTRTTKIDASEINTIPKQVPVAKPRTTIKSSRAPELDEGVKYEKCLPSKKEPMKIITPPNGVRKLRDHELLYFGVKPNAPSDTNLIINHNSQRKPNTNSNGNSNINLTNINRKHIEQVPNIVASKWKLSNDKPDLLRHSPITNKAPSPSLVNNNSIDDQPDQLIDSIEDEPLYENLEKPIKYKRNKDLERVEMILNEMNQTADQTLKTVSDRHKSQEQKNQRRLDRRPPKPLDTIDEKRSTRNAFDLESEKNKSSILLDGHFHRKCCSRSRSNSASSTCSSSSNISDSKPLRDTRSRSRSKEKLDNNKKLVQVKSSSSPSAVVVRTRTEHRSSSQDTRKYNQNINNSLENLVPPHKVERKIKRSSGSGTTKDQQQSNHLVHHLIHPTTSRSIAEPQHESNHNHHKLSPRSQIERLELISRHKQSNQSTSDHRKIPNDHNKSSQHSRMIADNSEHHRTRTSKSTDSERHRSIDRHKSTTSSSKPLNKHPENNKIKTTTETKHRSTRSSQGGIITKSPNTNQTTKSSSSRLHHRSSKDQLRK